MKHKKSPSASDGGQGRLAAIDWSAVAADLDAHGCAVIGPLLAPGQCEELAASYEADGIFRSRIVMARHGFGSGEYQYFGLVQLKVTVPGVYRAVRSWRSS